jgi:hypothetical protein
MVNEQIEEAARVFANYLDMCADPVPGFLQELKTSDSKRRINISHMSITLYNTIKAPGWWFTIGQKKIRTFSVLENHIRLVSLGK